MGSAADQRRHRRRVMRRAERASIGKFAAGDMSGDGMDHRHFEQFARRQRRQDRRQARRQHRLASAGRPAHQQIVTAGRGDLQRTFGAFLSLDVAQIGQIAGRRPHRRAGTRHDLHAANVIDELNQRTRRKHLHISGRPSGLGSAFIREDQSLPAPIGGDRGWQRASDRRQRAIQRQFAKHNEAIQRIRRNRADRRHHAQRNGKIVMAAFLRHVGGRQIDGDALRRQSEPGGDQRRPHPLARLRHRLVAQTNDIEHHRAAGNLHLHVDGSRLDSLEGDRRHPNRHRPAPPRLQTGYILTFEGPAPKNKRRTKARKKSDAEASLSYFMSVALMPVVDATRPASAHGSRGQ